MGCCLSIHELACSKACSCCCLSKRERIEVIDHEIYELRVNIRHLMRGIEEAKEGIKIHEMDIQDLQRERADLYEQLLVEKAEQELKEEAEKLLLLPFLFIINLGISKQIESSESCGNLLSLSSSLPSWFLLSSVVMYSSIAISVHSTPSTVVDTTPKASVYVCGGKRRSSGFCQKASANVTLNPAHPRVKYNCFI